MVLGFRIGFRLGSGYGLGSGLGRLRLVRSRECTMIMKILTMFSFIYAHRLLCQSERFIQEWP